MSSLFVRSIPVFAALALPACGGSTSPGTPDAGAGADAPTAPDASATPPPGITLLDYAIAVDVSPDGRTAVFEDISTPDATVYFFDTVTGKATKEVVVGEPSIDLATGISASGQVVAMHGNPVQAGVWTAAGGWVDIASPYPTSCDVQVAGGWDISADGKTVVGLAWNGCTAESFRWSEATGAGAFTTMQAVGLAPQGSQRPPDSRATVVSDDGVITAGWAEYDPLDRMAAAWDADGNGFLLDEAHTDAPSEVLSISGDGKTMAGVYGYDGFVWTKGTGEAPLLRFAVALPSDPVYPNAMSADGSVVFGGVGDAFSSIPIAFAWTDTGGMQQLTDVAKAGGVTLPDGILLNNVLGASADGTVLVGTAMDAAGNPKTFAMRIPATAVVR